MGYDIAGYPISFSNEVCVHLISVSFKAVCTSFSLYQNVPALLSFDHPRGSFQCLNGIRFLSFAWIVLGHTSLLGIRIYVITPAAGRHHII